MALHPGDYLLNGQYRILAQLGRGGYGYVYHAQDVHIGEHVAIKELIPGLVGDEAILQRFLAEARATMRLTHERIVRTYHVFPEHGNYYIVMEFMAGGSLEQRLQTLGALPFDEVLAIATGVCEGLDFAHRHGVVHCDLKPANVLFAADGSAKVADFGIAHVSGESLTRSWMTPAGFVAGTVPYMSPEQAEGVRDDPRIDLYALGAVLYRMLTGHLYLDFDQRETPGAQADNVYRIRNATPPPPSAYNRHIPAWLDAIVLKALAKQPGERYSSASELRIALQQQVLPQLPPALPRGTRPRQAGVPARPQDAPPPVGKQRRGPLPAGFWALAAAAGALLVILLVAISVLVNDAPGPGPSTNAVLGAVTVAPLTSTGSAGLPTETEAAPSAPVSPSPSPSQTLPPATATPRATSAPPTDTVTPPSTATSLPTPRPSPTATSSPTSRPAPTVTPRPTDTPRPAPRVYLLDEFDGAGLNDAIWQAYPNGGMVAVQNGRLELRAPSGSREFPYVHAKGNPFPAQGNWSARIDFAFPSVTWSGTGIVMGTQLPPNRTSEANLPGVFFFSIWQDKNINVSVSYGGYPSASTTVYRTSGPDTGHHSVQLAYRGEAYHVIVDGQEVYQSPPSGVRPTTLWFGNPTLLPSDDPLADLNWTALDIEHVSIQEVP